MKTVFGHFDKVSKEKNRGCFFQTYQINSRCANFSLSFSRSPVPLRGKARVLSLELFSALRDKLQLRT